MRFPAALFLLLGLSFLTAPRSLATPPPIIHGGGDFTSASTLADAGWRNFVGQARGRVGVANGVTLAGRPGLPAGFLRIEPRDAENWFAGLLHDLPPLPPDTTPAQLRLRGRLSATKAGPVIIRLESAPQHWLGLNLDLPHANEWVDFDWPLSEASSLGRFDPGSPQLRLVVAFRETSGPAWSSPGDNTLYIARAQLVIQP